MPDHNHLPTTGQTRETANSRQASQVSKEEYATRSQLWKEGSPAEWQAMLSDLAPITTEDDDDTISEEELDDDLWDNEIDLRDEDVLIPEDRERIGDEFILGHDEDPNSVHDIFESTSTSFRILVHSGKCRLEIPAWLRGSPPQDAAKHPLIEPFQRLETFDRLVGWLNLKRTAFLIDSDPWHLGVDALEELRKGTPSVTEKGLLSLLKLKAEISRHKRLCKLVWEDGSALSLDFLFRTEAKQAWVANALVQRYEDEPLTNEDMDLLKGLTNPKSAKAKKEIMSGGLDGLDFPTFVQRACLMAGTSWSGFPDVLRERILGV